MEAVYVEMAATPWSRRTFTLSTLFWILQLAAVISHITFFTIWIGFMGVKSTIDVLPYIYLTLLISTAFFTVLLLTETVFQLRSTLTLPRYHKLQLIKIRIAFIELLALGILCHGVESPDSSAMTMRVLVFTACASIPFCFSVGLAVWMTRREWKSVEMASKEVDEETPLLDGR